MTIKEQNQVNESGGGDKRKTRKNYALYVIKDKKKKSIEKNDKVKTDALNNNSNHQIFVRNTNCKRRSVLDKMTKKEIERREKEENENNKKEDEKKNNMIVEIKNNNKDASYFLVSSSNCFFRASSFLFFLPKKDFFSSSLSFFSSS